MTIRGVLFEAFGVLFDERAEFEALDATMLEATRRFFLDDAPAALSGDFSLALMEIVRGEPEAAEPAEFVPFERAAKDVFAAVLEVRGVTASEIDIAWFWDRLRLARRARMRLYPDAKKLLPRLAERGLVLGIVTDADATLVADALDATGASAWFRGVTTAADAGHVKPHPASCVLAVKKTGLPPRELAFVGASYERDLLAARGAGIWDSVLLDRYAARAGLPVKTVRTLAKLENAFERST
ncbi:MAG: HAD family hydrolase [Thermoplasmatota archaeon]